MSFKTKAKAQFIPMARAFFSYRLISSSALIYTDNESLISPLLKDDSRISLQAYISSVLLSGYSSSNSGCLQL